MSFETFRNLLKHASLAKDGDAQYEIKSQIEYTKVGKIGSFVEAFAKLFEQFR